jgi:hypothetical protein
VIGASIGRVVRRLFGLFWAFCANAIVGSDRGGGEDGGVDVGSEGSEDS